MRLSCGLSPYEGKRGISLPEFITKPSLHTVLQCYIMTAHRKRISNYPGTNVSAFTSPTQSQTAQGNC